MNDKTNLNEKIDNNEKAQHSENVLNYLDNNERSIELMYSDYECALMEVETKFKVLNKQFSLYYDRNPIESIKTRLKKRKSLMRKIIKYNVDLNIPSIMENINDIAGVRIICSFTEDIYELERCFLDQDDIILIQRKDYIENPKESGYRSLHLIVGVPIFLKDEKKIMRVEVQMRTIAMDFWASLEHKIRYKKNLSDADASAISKELKEVSDDVHKLDLKMENIHKHIIEARNETKPGTFTKFIKERLNKDVLNS